MEKKECLFCKIANNEIKSLVLAKTDNFVAILDVKPKSNGHTLIIPKEHSDNIFLMSRDNATELLIIMNKVKTILEKKLGATDFYLRSNIGKLAGQEVFHTHVHLVPVYKKDSKIEDINKIYSKLTSN